MKKIFFIALILIPSLSYSQALKQGGSKETLELKDVTGNYCIVQAEIDAFSNICTVKTDIGVFDFADKETGKKFKFQSDAQLLNMMDKNGWELIEAYKETLQYYIFKRKQEIEN